jgi:glycosyltransferase involved in cell wall biosynthesis
MASVVFRATAIKSFKQILRNRLDTSSSRDGQIIHRFAVKISIVIPAFNEEKLLAETLHRVQQSSQAFADRGWKVELIVCDNNSTDSTASIARDHGARVVFEACNQISRARNCGAAAASGDWLVFIDADSRPTPELFADVGAVITAGKSVAGGVTVRFDHAALAGRLVMKFWNGISRTLKWCAGSFIFVEANAFRSLGGFSEELFASEEIDFSQRAKKLGRALGRSVVILHRHPLETSARKLKLYSTRQHFRIFWKATFRMRQTLTNREDCHIWYDGKR